MIQNREVSTCFLVAGFCPKQYKRFHLPAKAPPSSVSAQFPEHLGFNEIEPWILIVFILKTNFGACVATLCRPGPKQDAFR